MAHTLIPHALMAHPVMARPRTRLDGKNLEPSLMAPASTARSTSTTFSDELTFPDEPTSDEPTSNEPTYSITRATSTSTIKREEKEKPKHSDSGQEVESGQALDSRQELDGGSWMAGRSWIDSGKRVCHRIFCPLCSSDGDAGTLGGEIYEHHNVCSLQPSRAYVICTCHTSCRAAYSEVCPFGQPVSASDHGRCTGMLA